MEMQQQTNLFEFRIEMRASMTELNVTATKRFNIGELFRKTIHGIGDMKNHS